MSTDEYDNHVTQHKNVLLVPEDAHPGTEDSYRTVNSALLYYSGKWNKEFTKMSEETDALLDKATQLNTLTGNFNLNLYQISVDLDGILAYIEAHPNFGT